MFYTTHRRAINSKDAIKTLQTAGWYEVSQKGSHKQFKHNNLPGRVTVPHPRKDIAIGTLKSIERQSGVKLR